MRLQAVTFALLLLAAGAGADEKPGGAPLESSKQALKSLQADQAAKSGDATAGRLTDGLPQLSTPVPGAVTPDYSPTGEAMKKERELQRKRAAQKNWLLNGVEKLGRDPKGRTAPAGEDRDVLPKDGEDEADSSDPDDLLTLYTEQKKAEDAKAEARQSTMARNDPIAPFLQGWLGNSPVRGKFFDEFVRKPDTGGEAVTSLGPAESSLTRVAAGLAPADEGIRGSAAATARPNPYLAGLELSALSDRGGGGRIDPSPGASLTLGGSGRTPAAPVGDADPPARPAEKKPSTLAPSDNEKYFPQQKKF